MVALLAGQSTNPAFTAYHYFWKAADWLFPPVCAGCGLFGYRLCPSCDSQIQPIQLPFCQICGQSSSSNQICDSCRSIPPSFTMLRALAIYSGPLRKAILELKFKHNIGISEVFALKLSRLVVSLEWKPDLVVAVPLNRIHLHARSYNQAELLARSLSWLIQVPYIPDAVERVKPTQSQVGLNAEQRKMNVHKAFFSHSELIKNKAILLVDDVATTCSTLNECSNALLNAGAKEVFALTVARAEIIQDLSIENFRSGSL